MLEFENPNLSISGIYPDLLHIVDLQICHDVICSTLLELSDASSPRDAVLGRLQRSYSSWCGEQRPMAHTCWLQLTPPVLNYWCFFQDCNTLQMTKIICYVFLDIYPSRYCSCTKGICKALYCKTFDFWGNNGLSIDFAKNLEGSCSKAICVLVGGRPFGLQ